MTGPRNSLEPRPRRARARLPWYVALCLPAAVACGGGDSPPSGPLTLATPAECNPLGGLACVTPWPSSIYATDDASTATGRRLDIPLGALPTNRMDVTVDPAPYNRRDGFSPAAPLVTAFAQGVDGELLVSHLDIPASVTDQSPTVIVDMQTGARVEHFAELDVNNADWPEQQALYIRPARRLEGGRRYAVAIRKSLKARDGSDLAMPEGFAAILSGTATDHALLERARPRYEDILQVLESAGVPRDDLLVAWDFTTASDELIRRDVIAARDRALPLMGPAGENLTYEIIDDTPHDDPAIRRYVHGEFDAPLLLGNNAAYEYQTVLLRDADGLPVTDGLYRVPFWAIVPECAYNAAEPVPIMVYLHGLLGTGEQATGSDVKDAAAALCMVVVGTDMRGMSTPDLPSVASALTDANRAGIMEQLVQGMVNHIALQHIARGPFAETLFVDDNGQSLVDAANVVVYGLSQGHIFGSTFLAYDPYIERGVFGVGGANYSLMLERSHNWTTYQLIMRGAYPDPLDQALVLNLFQHLWDATDPSGTANSLLTGDIPGTPEKHVLLHMGHADEAVPNLATAWQARTMGIPLLAPAPYEVHGLAAEEGALTDALVIWHGGVDDPPVGNTAPEDTRSHYVTRHQPAAFRQMARFYATGEIVNECAGACMCAEGACE